MEERIVDEEQKNVVDLAIDGQHYIDFCDATTEQQDLAAKIGAEVMLLDPASRLRVQAMCNTLGEVITNTCLCDAYEEEDVAHIMKWILAKAQKMNPAYTVE